MLRIDALTMKFSEIAVARDRACPACGDNPSVGESAGDRPRARARKEANVSDTDMTVKELKRRLDAGEEILIVDVREANEHQFCNIGGVLIPLGELPARVHELDAGREMVVYCRTGSRSARAAEFLRDSGFERVWNLQGGIRAWADEIDPALPRY
jgi:adenylyltransferase/sulfurtransferase